MRFSIIIPFYKGNEYLKDCLESLVEQTEDFGAGFEAVIIKDGAGSEADEIIAEYAKKLDIKVADTGSETPRGVAAARNVGLDMAKGEYVYFLDSDDYLQKGALAAIAALADEGEHKQIIYGHKQHTWYSKSGYEAIRREKELEKADEARRADEAKRAKSSADEDSDDADAAGDAESETASGALSNAAADLLTRRHGLRNVSVLGIAFDSEFVRQNSLSFCEKLKYYPDLPFVCRALECAEAAALCEDGWYVKRKHNDPINFPSLAQEKSDMRAYELLAAYDEAAAVISAEGDIKERLDRKLIAYFADNFAKKMKREHDPRWCGEWFEALRKRILAIPAQTVKKVPFKRRHLCRKLRKGGSRAVVRAISLQLGIKMLGKCLVSNKTRIREMYFHVFMKLPVKENIIMFECFFGKSYGDNPKPVYEYLATRYARRFKFVWSMDKLWHPEIPYKHVTVKRGGLRYAYYLARSKFFIFNTKQISWWIKRDGQRFIETWHGTPLKKLAFDMGDNFSAAPGYKKSIYRMTRDWDYLVAPNRFSADIFRSCFMYDGYMMCYGYPRNDVLHTGFEITRGYEVRKILKIFGRRRVILYAPTWRDDEYYKAGKYKFKLQLDLEKLRDAIGDQYVILIRTHYYVADKLDLTGLEDFAINVSNYSDISDLYLVSDICITDYSSVFFDYANLHRPILFYTYDIDKYRDMLRGFYFDMESTVPGPLLYTTEEVIDAIKNIEDVKERYKKRYDEFYERFCSWEMGHAACMVAEDAVINDWK